MRSFDFAANHFQKVQNSIERDHVAMIPGNGDTRHAFICVDDVANFLVAAAFSHRTGTFAIGGPEALTFLDVVRIYERILNVKLRVKKTPAFVFRMLSAVFGLYSPAASNLMCLNYMAAKEESSITPESALAFDVRLTSAESFLRAKSGLAAKAAG
jgi:nucleoside-diphosphate-sugar epimerase